MSNGKIAVLIPSVYDTLERELLSGIQTAAAAMDCDTLVFTGVTADNNEDYTSGENNIYELAFLSDIDAVIVCANRFGDSKLCMRLLKQLDKQGIPSVAIEEKYRSVDGIFSDCKQAIYDVTNHLIKDHGYRSIICLTGPEGNREAENRAEGFVRAMKEHNLANIGVIYGDFWLSSANELADDIISGKREIPQAVVCTNDVMAVALCQKFYENGIKVPEQVAVTGYDGSVYTMLTRPPVTTVCGGNRMLGIRAVKALAEKLGRECTVESTQFHIRYSGSCGCRDEARDKEHLLGYTEEIIQRQLEHKTFMYSNYIARMSDCESVPKFASVLDSLRYMLSDCSAINVCVCEDWRVEHPTYRKSGFSDTMRLIYSENQPGQLDFPLRKLLPCLNLPHKPQFWVFSSVHYSDRIIGYIATMYEDAKKFSADEHYIGWCDAVANGLDIVIKKSNTEYIWQKLEEKNMSDIYTGLLSKRGFLSNINKHDVIVFVGFPKRYSDMPYFIPIVSAVLRSDSKTRTAVHISEMVFAVLMRSEELAGFSDGLCGAISELGIYITSSELEIASENAGDSLWDEERLARTALMLSEKNTQKSSEAYSKIFAQLRNSMKYSPQDDWSILSGAQKTGLSRSHFQRLYKKYFGVSFTEELIAFRIDRAKYLLSNTSMPVQRIAEACGYSTYAHFMRQFKLRVGTSAVSYRKCEQEIQKHPNNI